MLWDVEGVKISVNSISILTTLQWSTTVNGAKGCTWSVWGALTLMDWIR